MLGGLNIRGFRLDQAAAKRLQQEFMSLSGKPKEQRQDKQPPRQQVGKRGRRSAAVQPFEDQLSSEARRKIGGTFTERAPSRRSRAACKRPVAVAEADGSRPGKTPFIRPGADQVSGARGPLRGMKMTTIITDRERAQAAEIERLQAQRRKHWSRRYPQIDKQRFSPCRRARACRPNAPAKHARHRAESMRGKRGSR